MMRIWTNHHIVLFVHNVIQAIAFAALTLRKWLTNLGGKPFNEAPAVQQMKRLGGGVLQHSDEAIDEGLNGGV